MGEGRKRIKIRGGGEEKRGQREKKEDKRGKRGGGGVRIGGEVEGELPEE